MFDHELTSGIGLYFNAFFLFYRLLTDLHLVHVLTGIVIIAVAIANNSRDGLSIDSMEATAAFWHMGYFIGFILFPMLYLVQWQ